MIAIVLLYALCASTFTISKWGLAYTAPLFFVAVRMILSGLLLGGYFVARYGIKFVNQISVRPEWFLFSQIVLFHIYLPYICDLCALTAISSVESAFIYNLSPFFSALFSYFWFNEHMTFKKWIGFGLGLAAFIPELFSGPVSELFSFSHTIPRLMTLIAVISSSYGWIIVRSLVKRGYSPIFINGFGMFFGGLASLLTSFMIESWTPFPVTQWVPFIQATILIIVVANILFYNLYGYLLEFYTATILSFAGFMCPLFAGLFGYIFLGETFSPLLLVSFCMVLIGLIIFYHEELRQGYIKSK
jgi:drug/metabolite transporter (DMT)-like permease